MTAPVIRILLADDQPLQREGFRMILESQPGFEVVGEAGDGAQLLAHARRIPVDVILMDIQMPRVNGLVASERVTHDKQVRDFQQRVPRIILLTAIDLDDHLPAAAVAGVFAVMYKDTEPEQLIEAVREAAASRATP